MPDTNSPKVTRAQGLPIMLSELRSEQPPLSRKWSCPGDHTIAAYADGMLSKYPRAWVEFHLSSCTRCRQLVADIVKAQREPDLPLPPIQVIQKAMSLVEGRPKRRRRVWAPVGALAGIALLVVFIVVFRKPSQQLVVLSPPTPAAPLVAKSEPTSPLQPAPDLVRKPRTPELSLTILFPQTSSVMSSGRLRFSWRPVPHSRSYQVRLVETDGDLVWEGQTDKSALQLPTEVDVKDGSYFVWITAFLEDGRIVKSVPVRFLVER